MKSGIAFGITVLALAHGAALAHGGGLNSEGCHNNRKTGDYHCHRAPAPPVQRFAPEPQRAQSLAPLDRRLQVGTDTSLAARERALIERERLLIERERALAGGRPPVPATQALAPKIRRAALAAPPVTSAREAARTPSPRAVARTTAAADAAFVRRHRLRIGP
jgi:hypothetical protein